MSTTVAPPQRSFTRWIGRQVLRVLGWKLEGQRPEMPSYILVAAPHTSNWDLLYMLCAAWALQMPLQWLGKHTLFQGPFGPLLRRLGGIPINRGSPQHMVLTLVREFRNRPSLVLAIAPEGTRSKAEGWRTGFYYIARSARVPIVLGFLDYGHKAVGIGPALRPSGDIEADMVTIRAFYDGKQGKYPAKMSPVVALDPRPQRGSGEAVAG